MSNVISRSFEFWKDLEKMPLEWRRFILELDLVPKAVASSSCDNHRYLSPQQLRVDVFRRLFDSFEFELPQINSCQVSCIRFFERQHKRHFDEVALDYGEQLNINFPE